MKQVYILLSRTETLPARFIYRMTGGAFTHASIALTPETDRFYSYARRRPRNFLRAGLIVENIHDGVFSLYPNCHCSLYAITVSDEAYQNMERCIASYLAHYQEAKYNFLGILPLRMGIRWQRKYRLACSQFVAVVLAAAKEISLPKDPYLMLPSDFSQILHAQKIYDGILTNCSFSSHDTLISFHK